MDSDRLIRILRSFLPSPFTIAVGLTAIAFALAMIFGQSSTTNALDHWVELSQQWATGLWNPSLLVFAVQMMLMLVLGHVLALSKPVDSFISKVTSSFCTSGPSSVYVVTLLTIIVALYNWGLGLIFGAILARKVGEHAAKNGIKLDYAMLGAAGYSGLMVWHGGFSGSSLSKVAEPNHLREMASESGMSASLIESIPEAIGYAETVFSSMNVWTSILLLLILPASMWLMAKRNSSSVPVLSESNYFVSENTIDEPAIADKLDSSKLIAVLFGVLIFISAIIQAYTNPGFSNFSFINPNWINLSLLGLGIIFHGTFSSFLKAIDQAISGAAGILIQFPLYFGVMAIMSQSGLIQSIANGFVGLCENSASPNTLYPILTFFSAGVINVFVPSGGGQWAVQGPVIVQAAAQLNIPLAKSILAMAYGDQLTNMLQPFWALPLLGITGLKAKQILPFSLVLMLVGGLIFLAMLLVF